MTKKDKLMTGTLEEQRVINALLSDVTLTLAKPEAGTVAEVGDEKFVRVGPLVTDVSAALGVPEENVRMALTAAVSQGLLEVPSTLPPSEHQITLVRPGTL
jgi:hypothetical protein